MLQCANCLERGVGRGERILHSDLHVGAVAKKQDKKEINLFFFLSGGEVVGEGQGRTTLSASCEGDAIAPPSISCGSPPAFLGTTAAPHCSAFDSIAVWKKAAASATRRGD